MINFIRDTMYIDHVNNRWEALCYIDGDKYNTGVHRSHKSDLVRLLRGQGYQVIDINKA